MNFVAHLYLAQPSADSYFGNLLGDFRRGVTVEDYSPAVQAGVANHIHVDKFTDRHDLVKGALAQISPRRRRFGGIILDVLFDHFLLKHWARYSHLSADTFTQQAYQRLAERVSVMPSRMQRVVTSMIEHEWLDTYKTLSGVGHALERTASRIRFAHQFDGSIEEVFSNYDDFEGIFLAFFPQLIASVNVAAIEQPQ